MRWWDGGGRGGGEGNKHINSTPVNSTQYVRTLSGLLQQPFHATKPSTIKEHTYTFR